jgi:amino acid adenylation domain-containing protein
MSNDGLLTPEVTEVAKQYGSMAARHPETTNEYPLSSPQLRLWFVAQLDPGNVAYNLSSVYSLRGELDRTALERALREIVCRHDILRTTFATVDGEPRQFVAPHLACSLRFSDLTDTTQDPSTEISKAVASISHQPFDLSKDTLFRITLFRIGDTEHVLNIVMHHIITDGWSNSVFIDELGALYAACAGAQPAKLEPLPMQYGDFAVTQRLRLTDGTLDRQLDYWKTQLKDVQPLQLPTDKQRPSRQTFDGRSVDWTISEGLAASLRALANDHKVTLFMLLLAAMKVLLARYCQQSDIVVGMPIANRTRSELEGLIGFFVNTLALRTDLAGDPPFTDLLERVRETALQAYRNQDLPFEKLVETLQPERDLSRNPVFQVFFAFQNVPNFQRDFAGLTIERLPQERTNAITDIELYVRAGSGTLHCTLVYNTALFDAATIDRMRNHYQTVLEAIVANPELRVAQIPLLMPEEWQRLVIDWNATAATYSRDATLAQLFEEQVARTPNEVALNFGDMHLTYTELNRRANQLAHYLRRLGVAPEDPVGIYVERSLAQVVAILGIVKSGGAYVPLDPDYPLERLQFMLEDSGAQILLTQRRIRELPADYTGKIVIIDGDAAEFACEPSHDPVGITSADQAAYVIYTSGSTGTPNGVIGLHRGAVNRCAWMWRAYPFRDGEVCCLKTRFSFVDSVWEIFGPLLQGVRMVAIPDAIVQDPERLVETLASSGVTRLVVVPSLLRALLDSVTDLAARLPALELWITSGEALPYELFARFRVALPDCRLLNLYGSSEISADVTACELTLDGRPERVSIGRPIANTKIYVLDEVQNPVPVGVPGELYVGGDGLARGYWRRPDLTADRFVPDPFSHTPGSQLFRTGDRARYWADGEIEFLGRTDSQLKLRGFRIESGEVEAGLDAVDGIDMAAVVLKRDAKGVEYLAAFYQTSDGVDVAAATIHESLRRCLPNYMLPATLTRLESLPLTPSGKIDRKHLTEATPDDRMPRERGAGRTTHSARARAQAELSERMTEIWEHVLSRDGIGPNDNFFDLGGHSFLAVRLILEIEKVFGVRLPIHTLFEAPTVAGLARRLKLQTGGATYFTLAPVTPDCSAVPLFVVNGLFLYRELARALGPDQPTYGVFIEEEVNIRGIQTNLQAEVPLPTVEQIASKYIAQIRAIQPSGPYQLAGVSFAGVLAFEMAQQLIADGDRVATLALFDTNAPGLMTASYGRRLRNHVKNIVTDGAPYLGRLSKGWLARIIGILRRRSASLADDAAAIYLRGDVYRAYRPRSYPGQIVIFRAAENSWLGYDRPDDLGWGPYAARGVAVHEVPGDHLGILSAPNVRMLAQTLKDYLLASTTDVSIDLAGAHENSDSRDIRAV